MKFDFSVVGLGCSISQIGNLSQLFSYLYRSELTATKRKVGSASISDCIKESATGLRLMGKKILVYTLGVRPEDLDCVCQTIENITPTEWRLESSCTRLSEALLLSSKELMKGSYDLVVLIQSDSKLEAESFASVVLEQNSSQTVREIDNSIAYVSIPQEIGNLTATEDSLELLFIRQQDDSLIEKLASVERRVSSDNGAIAINFCREVEADSSLFQLIKAVLSVSTSTLPAGEELKLSKEKTKSMFFSPQTGRPWISAQKIGDYRPKFAGLLDDGDQGLLFIGVKENTKLPKLPIEIDQDSELIVIGASDEAALKIKLSLLSQKLNVSPELRLKDVAYTLNKAGKEDISQNNYAVLSIVASSTEDLIDKLIQAAMVVEAQEELASGKLSGIYYTNEKDRIEGDITFLLPGLGSAYPFMLSDLWFTHPIIRVSFDSLDYMAKQAGCEILPSHLIFPAESSMNKASASAALTKAEFAVAAVLLIEFALDFALKDMELKPHSYLGLSTGEYGSYFMNGYSNIETIAERFYKFSVEVARSLPKASTESISTYNIFASRKLVEKHMDDLNADIHMVADLSPQHMIVTGDSEALHKLSLKLSEEGITALRSPVAIPYHTPLVEGLLSTEEAFSFSDSYEFGEMTVPTWSSALADRAPEDKEAIDKLAVSIFQMPIRFQETIEKAYADGSRVFVEIGPGSLLTAKVNEILSDKQKIAVYTNNQSKSSLTQLNNLFGLMISQGRVLKLEKLYWRRDCREIENLLDFSPEKSAYLTEEEEPSASVLSNFLYSMDKINQVATEAIQEVLDNFHSLPEATNAGNDSEEIVHLELGDEDKAILVWVPTKNFDLRPEEYEKCLVKHFSEEERKVHSTKFRDESRKLQWFLGRIAAKKAVQELLSKTFKKTFEAHKISIIADQNKRPVASTEIEGKKVFIPLSISHTRDLACALGTFSLDASRFPGVDIEKIRLLEEDMAELVLNEAESQKLKEAENHDQMFLKFWTAKEASYKSRGGKSIKDFELVGISPDGNVITMQDQSSRFKVYTGVKDDHIYSFTVPELGLD